MESRRQLGSGRSDEGSISHGKERGGIQGPTQGATSHYACGLRTKPQPLQDATGDRYTHVYNLAGTTFISFEFLIYVLLTSRPWRRSLDNRSGFFYVTEYASPLGSGHQCLAQWSRGWKYRRGKPPPRGPMPYPSYGKADVDSVDVLAPKPIYKGEVYVRFPTYLTCSSFQGQPSQPMDAYLTEITRQVGGFGQSESKACDVMTICHCQPHYSNHFCRVYNFRLSS